MSKIKIWAPWPYEVVAVRGPEQGEYYLNGQGEAERAAFTHQAFYPILERTTKNEDQLVSQGLRGYYADSDEEWVKSEMALEKKVYSCRTEINWGRDNYQQDVVIYVDCLGDEWGLFRPTQIQSEVEVEDPKGYRVVGYGKPLRGELYCVNPSAAILIGPAVFDTLLLNKAGEIPNFEHLGNKCRFSDDGANWETGQLRSVELTPGGTIYRKLDTWYSYCELFE